MPLRALIVANNLAFFSEIFVLMAKVLSITVLR